MPHGLQLLQSEENQMVRPNVPWLSTSVCDRDGNRLTRTSNGRRPCTNCIVSSGTTSQDECQDRSRCAMATDVEQDYHEECVFATRNRQTNGKGRQDFQAIRNRLSRIGTLLPNQTEAPSKAAQPNARQGITLQRNENMFSIQSKSYHREPETPDLAPSRSHRHRPSLDKFRSPEPLPRYQLSEEPAQAVGERFTPAVIHATSPSETTHAVQQHPMPSLTITAHQGEDDGTCALPPEEEVSSLGATLPLRFLR